MDSFKSSSIVLTPAGCPFVNSQIYSTSSFDGRKGSPCSPDCLHTRFTTSSNSSCVKNKPISRLPWERQIETRWSSLNFMGVGVGTGFGPIGWEKCDHRTTHSSWQILQEVIPEIGIFIGQLGFVNYYQSFHPPIGLLQLLLGNYVEKLSLWYDQTSSAIVRGHLHKRTSLAENGVLINGVNLVPLYIEVFTRTLCNKLLFDLKVLKNDRFLSQDHEIIKRFYMVSTFSLKSLFYFEKPCKACFAW